MIFNIRKMLSGGGIAPFSIYTPVQINDAAPRADLNALESTTTKASSKSSTAGEITDKDLLEMLGKVDGLPSDMNAILSSVQKFYSGPGSGSTLSASNLSSRYVRALALIQNAKFSKALYDLARKAVTTNGGLNEVAIDSDGKLVVLNSKKEIDRVTVDTYNNNRDKYLVLSNGELLDFRAYSKPLDDGIFTIVLNGVGMDAVNKYILNTLQGLGENSETLEGYLKKSSGGLMKEGADILNALAEEGYDMTGGLDGLFKTKVITKELKSNAEKVLKYIFLTMPDNMKTLLEYKTGSKENAQKSIIDFVTSKTKNDRQISSQMILDASGQKPGSKKSGSSSSEESGGPSDDDKWKDNIYTSIIKGTGGSASTFTLMDKDGKTMQMSGVSYPQLGKNGDLQDCSLLTFMSKFNSINRAGNFATTFGDLVIEGSDLDSLVYLNDGQAIRTYLPIKLGEGGRIVPDLEFAKLHDDLVKLINNKASSGQNPMKDPDVLKKCLELGLVNSFTKELDTNKFAPFLCINGMGTSRNLKESNNYITEIKGDQLEKQVERFSNILYSKDGKEGSEKKFDFDFESMMPWDWFGHYDKLYKGTVYIPVTQNINQGLIGGDGDLYTVQQNQYEEDYNRFLTQSALNDSSSDLLGI